MKSDIKKISDSKAELTISAGEETLKEIKNEVLKKMRPEVSAPGFRKGKVPLNLVEKQVDDNYFKSQFLDEAMNTLFQRAVMDHKIRPISQPQVEVKKFVPFNEFEFSVSVDVVPPVKLGDYKKIRKKATAAKATNKDVDEVIGNLRVRLADKTEVQREVKDGDEVWIDFSGVDDKGEDVAGASGKDFPLRIGSNTFIEGFEEKLIGLKPGDDTKFKLRFPKDYGHAPMANMQVEFSVNIKKVHDVVLPEVDEAFVSKVGPFKTEEDLRSDIKEQLKLQKNQEAQTQLQDEIIGELVEKTKVALPEQLVENSMESIMMDFKQNLVYRGITFPEYLKQAGLSEDQYKDNEVRPKAEQRVKTSLVLSEVAREEDLQVTPEEVSIRIQLLQGQHKNDPQMMAQLNTPEAEDEIASRLMNEKTIERLVEYASKSK